VTAPLSRASADPADETPRIRLSSPEGWWLIVATSLASGMIFLDGSVVNVALPVMQRDLNASLSGLQWIVNAYMLFLAALLMIGGGIGDSYGRKLAFQWGLAIFAVSSAACGFAPNLNVLIAARAVQGFGGALLVPGSLAMIKALIVPEESGRAIGLWAGFSGVTSALGPLVGGYLVTAVSWRAIFFINVPLAALTLWAMAVHVPNSRDPNAPPTLDWPAGLLSILGLGGLSYVLIEQPTRGWTDPTILIGIAAVAIGIALFPVREIRARYPMIPLHAFRSRTFDGANIATIGVYFTFGGALPFLTLDLQQLQGFTPLEAGAAFLPVTLLLLFLSPRVGGLMSRFGARLPLTVGPVIIAVGFVYLMRVGTSINYWTDILPGVVILGLGMSFFVTPLTATVMNAVPERLAGVASGISNTLTRIASLLAVAILGLIIAHRFESTLTSRLSHTTLPASARSALIARSDRLADDPLPHGLSASQQSQATSAIDAAYVDGFRWIMATCAVLCLLSALVCFLTIESKREPT
jgi:EmrB/QacA subfamily drug resistance transporter